METISKRTVSTAAIVLDEVVLRTLQFPLWWYTRGVADLGRTLLRIELGWFERLGIRILLANLFVPMFGDYTRSGRAISFVVRLFLFVAKGIFVAFLTLVLAVAFLAYLLFPPIVTLQLLYQFGGPLLLR